MKIKAVFMSRPKSKSRRAFSKEKTNNYILIFFLSAAVVLGVIIFIIVLILGHSLNFGLNALGAYVHTNRLQYVEFFGKFYEGDGRKFQPFKAKTQYYNLSKGDNK